MPKKTRLRARFDKEYGKRAQALLKFGLQHLYHFCCSLARKLISKKSLLFKCQVFGLLVKKLATDEEHPVLNRDNLTIPIQMQLSHNEKTFSRFFAAFLKSRLNFEYFE